MPIQLYLDHNVERAIGEGLRRRRVDVLTAFEDSTHELADADLLSRATVLGRPLVSRDADFLAEASHRQGDLSPFAGVIYLRRGSSIGSCVGDLEIVAKAGKPEDLANQILHLPIR